MIIPPHLAAEWRAAQTEYADAMRDAPRQEYPYRALTSRQLGAIKQRLAVALRCMLAATDDDGG